MNIHELDAASNNSVDDIRSLVEQVRFAPQAGKYKVYIVDEVHMLSTAAFNAFLKTLEDPVAISGRLGIPEAVPSGLPVDR